MATTLDRALEVTRRGVGQPSLRRMAKDALLACGIGCRPALVPPVAEFTAPRLLPRIRAWPARSGLA